MTVTLLELPQTVSCQAVTRVQGFFKRSLQKADSYRCFNDGECSLGRSHRTRCKACRFRRCLAVGMSITGLSVCLLSALLYLHRRRFLKTFALGRNVP